SAVWGASTWAWNAQAWKWYGRWRTMNTVPESSPGTGPMLPGFETCESATERWPTPAAYSHGPDSNPPGITKLDSAVRPELASHPSTSSAAASPASPSPTLAGDWAPRTNAGYGPSSGVSFARLGPTGCWLRTSQGYVQPMLDGSLEEYCETWPRAGMTRSGTAYRLQGLGLHTSESGCSSWPTPQAHDTAKGKAERVGRYGTEHGGRNLNDEVAMWPTPAAGMADRGDRGDLNTAVKGLPSPSGHTKMLPTPTQSDGMGGPGCSGRDGGKNLRTVAGGQLSATWTELLMGLPAGWTELLDGNAASPEPPKGKETGCSD
ncbi:hypothetical protein LCGC14_2751210, partial [marine sediment metagenome]